MRDAGPAFSQPPTHTHFTQLFRSFLELAKALAAAITAEIMRDAGLADQFGRLYAHPEWAGGGTTATIVATLQGARFFV